MDRLTRPAQPARLRDGRWLAVRFIRPDDAPRVVAFVEGLSAETRYRRFFTARRTLTADEADRCAAVDHRERDALVACIPGEDGSGPIVAVARYARVAPEAVEAALVVGDAYQGLGLGGILLGRLIGLLRQRRFRYLRGAVLADNARILGMLRSMGYPITVARDGIVLTVQLGLRRPAPRP